MFSRLASLFGGSKIQYVAVKYENKEYRITFTPEDYSGNSVTVGSLRNMLAKQFKVPATHLSLFVLKPQRKMSNNKAFLEDYGLENGSTVVAVFKTGEAAESAPAKAPKATTAPPTPKQQLEAVTKAVDVDLGEDRINAFVRAPPADEKARDKEYRLLSEIILQNTIKLDNVDVSESQDLRAQRKALINKFHKYHADIDAANEGKPAPASQSPSPKPAGGKRKRKNKKK